LQSSPSSIDLHRVALDALEEFLIGRVAQSFITENAVGRPELRTQLANESLDERWRALGAGRRIERERRMGRTFICVFDCRGENRQTE
jgi:hypothetical protein